MHERLDLPPKEQKIREAVKAKVLSSVKPLGTPQKQCAPTQDPNHREVQSQQRRLADAA